MKLLALVFFIAVFFPRVDLEQRSILDDKIELLVPKTFKVVTKEMLGKKYPVVYINNDKKPTLVLTDDSAKVFLAFSFTQITIKDQFESEMMVLNESSFKKGFLEAFTSSNFIDDGVKTVNRKSVGYFKLTTDVTGQNMYHYFFMVYVNKRLLDCSFSCPEKLMPEWEETAEQIVSSLKVK